MLSPEAQLLRGRGFAQLETSLANRPDFRNALSGFPTRGMIAQLTQSRLFTGRRLYTLLMAAKRSRDEGLNNIPISNRSDSVSMSRLARLSNEFLRKMEDYVLTEAKRLSKTNRGKLRLIGTALGIVVVILVGLWIANHP